MKLREKIERIISKSKGGIIFSIRIMESKTIINCLRELQKEMEPFTKSSSLGAKLWNGTQYVKQEEILQIDAYALSWWNSLRITADLIEAQDCPISDKQINHIKKLFCGGMGSFADYEIDIKVWGQKAKIANENINRIRNKLFRLIRLFK